MTRTRSRAPFALVTAAYQAFTLSDGALRMLVLLHLHAQGNTASALALVLLPYEAAGVFTNLLGGWLGGRFGLKVTLLAGLLLQTLACGLLAVDAAWLTVPYVMATQVLSGIAKDLAKTAAKSYVKQLAPTADGHRLFGLVAFVTGSKNAVKGLGFFAGGALLAWCGFQATNLALGGILLAMALLAARMLPPLPGRPQTAWRDVLQQGPALRWLALARAFLFGSRDVWFAVALPVFLSSVLQWPAGTVGGVLAAWVIGYGLVQALVPRWLPATSLRQGARHAAAASLLAALPLAAARSGGITTGPTVLVLLGVYGVFFAAASSLHSWLVVALAGDEKTAERVGFYYAANSLGRLTGTLASGALYVRAANGADGLAATMLAATFAAIVAALCTLPVRIDAA